MRQWPLKSKQHNKLPVFDSFVEFPQEGSCLFSAQFETGNRIALSQQSGTETGFMFYPDASVSNGLMLFV